MKDITSEEWQKLYRTLSADLKQAVISAENADHVFETARRNNLDESQIPHLATLIDSVLLGLLPPDEFQASLEKELGLEKTLARKISQEINRFIFFPVKQSLAEIYKIGLEQAPSKSEIPQPPATPVGSAAPEPNPELPKKPRASKADSYREPLE